MQILRPDDASDPLGYAGLGKVPTLGGNIATALPGPGGSPSPVQVQQGTTTATQAASQALVFPPIPYAVLQKIDPSGALTMWLTTLIRKLGGYAATPADDALVSEDAGQSVDLYARTLLADLQAMPNDQALQIADLYRRLDELTQVVISSQAQGWNRQPAQAAATTQAPAGGTGTAAGGWDTAANRDTAIAYLNNVGSRLVALETKLKTAQITY